MGGTYGHSYFLKGKKKKKNQHSSLPALIQRSWIEDEGANFVKCQMSWALVVWMYISRQLRLFVSRTS